MKKIFLIHPFLFGIYPVIFLYAFNITEYTLSVIFIPLLLAILYSGLVFLFIKLIVKKINIASIVSSFIIFYTLSYGRILENTKSLTIKNNFFTISNETVTNTIFVIILCIVIYFLYKFPKIITPFNKILTIFVSVLLFFSSTTIIPYEIKTGRLWTKESVSSASQQKTTTTISQTPDIYYIIFDRYGGEKALLEQYGFDNSSFINFLKEKGFYVATNSTANYPKTFLSLASSLNMEYLDYLTIQTTKEQKGDEAIVTPLIRNNKVINFLKNNGYTYIHIGSWWTPTRTNEYADINFIFNKGTYPHADEFTSGLLNTTIASPILKEVFKDETAVSKNPTNNDHRSRIYYSFESIQKVPEIKSPKFVFMHVLAPHDPFVLGKNCEPLKESDVTNKTHQENYKNQITCVNTKIKEMVNYLLKNSENPPIIIIQADEGPFPMNSPISKEQGWKTATDQALQEKFPILNAYYIPEIKENTLYDTITPVNTFRILFNTYFKTDYPLLEDKNYIFDDKNNYYKFTEVTNRL